MRWPFVINATDVETQVITIRQVVFDTNTSMLIGVMAPHQGAVPKLAQRQHTRPSQVVSQHLLNVAAEALNKLLSRFVATELRAPIAMLP